MSGSDSLGSVNYECMRCGTHVTAASVYFVSPDNQL